MGIEGHWLYSHQERRIVDANMMCWRPDLNTGSKFGCGIYFARGIWHSDAKWVIRCTVSLSVDEVIDRFPVVAGFEDKGPGKTEGHFERYLRAQKVVKGRPKAEKGDSEQNCRIANYFLREKGIRAAHFSEHDTEVLVVYDTTAISIIGIESVSVSR